MTTTGPAYALPDDDLLGRCRVEHFRSGGPGGQHAAKNDTAIRLTHPDTGVQAACGTHRERRRNRADALAQLRLRLALAIRGQADRAWLEERRQGSRLPVGAGAKGFHLVVAVLLDELAAQAGQLGETARALGISTSQLVKVLGADGEARRATERLLAEEGRPPVRWR